MNEALKAVLFHLFNRRYIGGKHTPEEKLINSRIKWIDSKERREFEKGYKDIINQGFIIRIKKRTGKGSDWHISLDPKMLKELFEMLN